MRSKSKSGMVTLDIPKNEISITISILFPKIGDAKVKFTLGAFKQWLTLKI